MTLIYTCQLHSSSNEASFTLLFLLNFKLVEIHSQIPKFSTWDVGIFLWILVDHK